MSAAALNKLAVRAAPVVKPLITVQSATMVRGPPRVRISKAEKLVSGILLSAGIVTPTGYLLYNVKNYRKRE